MTHRRVAAEAALPVAATTYWFASKDELVAEAYRLAAARDVERIERVAASVAGAPADDLPGMIADLLVRELAEGRTALIAAYSLWIEAARRPTLREVEQGWTEAYRETVEGLLLAGGSPRPAFDARLVVAVLDGLLLEQLSRPEAEPDAELPALVRRLLDALLPPG